MVIVHCMLLLLHARAHWNADLNCSPGSWLCCTTQNVTISIPVPGQPVVNSSDGDTTYHKRDGVLEWTLDIVDSDNAEGSLEFKVDAADNDEFFPVSVNFSSETTWAGFAVEGVEQAGADVDYSSEVSFGVDSYEYV